MNNYKIPGLAVGVLLAAIGTQAAATELVYTPINPSFGGNPLNGTWLLNNAQSQNDHEDPSISRRTSGIAQTSALDRFTQQLQGRLLSGLIDNINNGESGTLTTDAFIVDVIAGADGAMTINVTDRATGQISVINLN